MGFIHKKLCVFIALIFLFVVNVLFDYAAYAQTPQGKTIKLGTFTITPTRTPTPIRVTGNPTIPFTSQTPQPFTTHVPQPSQQPQPHVLTKTFTLPVAPDCHFKASDFTEVYEFGGVLYGLYPQTTASHKQAGWYTLAPEFFSKTREENKKSLAEFLKYIPVAKNDPTLELWKHAIEKCIEIGFSSCAGRIAGICTENCTLTSPIPTGAIPAPLSTPSPSPYQPQTVPQPSVSSGLCQPVEINGSVADKLDMLIIGLNFTKDEFKSNMLPLAQRAVQALTTTNLNDYQDDVLKKMNWYLLNIHDSGFPVEYFKQFEKGDEASVEELRNSLIDFGVEAKYCARDRFMIIVKGNSNSGFAVRGLGGVIWSSNVDVGGDGLTFVHEWGHAVGDLMDEYKGARNTIIAANCAQTPSSGALNGDYAQACPQWDCGIMNCSPKVKQLLQGSGCYPRCGAAGYYRPLENSIMDTIDAPGGTKFSGPALVNIIEKVFKAYR